MQWKQKQKQLRCSAHAARQDGSGACRAKESTNGPAWVCMQYIQWAHYVCASWGEVRARVHARGHTQRSERRMSVCAGGARLSLPHSHAATTAAAAAHAKTRRSKRGEVVWKTAVLPSLSPGLVILFMLIFLNAAVFSSAVASFLAAASAPSVSFPSLFFCTFCIFFSFCSSFVFFSGGCLFVFFFFFFFAASASSQTPRAADPTTNHRIIRLIDCGNAFVVESKDCDCLGMPSMHDGPYATE
ncbi:nucleolar RNA helicase II [Trypanosoma cruzi]|uniref:Nucleolar RNA helicase II n=1 Tax=Trypanosoma cruzi TaxID=5693 RepID=A0A7J6XGX3_TRYCR|nr:nucleolar RNA helicase II [Trypanosoma cruzi]